MSISRIFGISILSMVPAIATAPAQASADDSELIYECALALDFASSKGVQHSVPGSRAMAHFGEETGNDPAARARAAKAIDTIWADYKKKNGRSGLDQYVLGIAQDCSDLYDERTEMQSAEQEGQLNSLGTLSAASLRAYINRTGDYGAVADYLVYHYPYGKSMFKPNEDGDLLGNIIVEIGASGLRKLSDEAVYTIANKFYWQYNPPATRLVFAEYQRRMRMKRQSENDARQWAQRAADDRAQQARQANARPVGSLGTGKPYKPKRGSGLVVCTSYSGTGGGTVCKED
ncbi:hypothetical protein [Sphingorhabdus sp. 109]|jgi:hypothetical protein|uniref:hypothetical protein n=1 Tax=Sphingorhabdus sp. 109 TaxID=2653173 RepID=UPI0012EF1C5F|nr:hypothetical protein [Sphingorhabdus sp. 109]VWX57285.1 conserved exported hypothetical protein [Sphingorhabdus sp. 109]